METSTGPTGPGRSSPRFGIVVPTIGRVPELDGLLRSLDDQDSRDFTVVIQVQANHEAVEGLVDRFRKMSDVPVHVVTGDARGVSAGRNAAEEILAEDVDYLLFPNDTSVYPPGLLTELATSLAGASAGAMTVIDRYGAKFVLQHGATLDKRTVWSVISPGLVVARTHFRELGGFDESLGTGAAAPWQSAEETDFLLRYRRRFGSGGFVWLPHLSVRGRSDSDGLSAAERRRKLRAYARGYGRVLRRHRYGALWHVRALVAGATFGLRRREQFDPVDGWWVLLGRAEGLVGHVIGPRGRQAVTR